jgi:predicted NAD/FAD-binding protein
MRSADKKYGSRREVLGALAGAALLPGSSSAEDVSRRQVGIVGGGMAGVSLAWLLDGQCEVVLFEAQPSLGGNVQTIELELDGQAFQVDMGAQYFHPKLYPFYVRLLKMLGLFPLELGQSHSFPASITLFADSEATPRFVSPLLPERWWPILAPWNWDGLGAFATGFDAAKTREEQNGDWGMTLDAWLQTLGLSRGQWEGMLLPWAASLFTGRIDQARAMSARAALIFAATSVPDNILDPVVWYVLNRGMAEPLRRMGDQIRSARILTGAEVKRVSREPRGQFLLECVDGRSARVDDLVLASSGPASLRLLQQLPGTGAWQSALRGIEFEDTRIAVHRDPAYAPRDPDHWSFLNCQIHDGYCEASMSLASVLKPSPYGTGPKLWKSWVTHRNQPPGIVLHESNFRHMVPTVATLKAQAKLQELQGRNGIWVAGGYTFPYDSQETALVSALNVVSGLKASSVRALSLFPG